MRSAHSCEAQRGLVVRRELGEVSVVIRLGLDFGDGVYQLFRLFALITGRMNTFVSTGMQMVPSWYRGLRV